MISLFHELEMLPMPMNSQVNVKGSQGYVEKEVSLPQAQDDINMAAEGRGEYGNSK